MEAFEMKRQTHQTPRAFGLETAQRELAKT